MKNIFDLEARNELLARIEKVTPDQKALWGKMNINQGLRHMRMAFEIPTGRLNPTIAKPVKMPKWLLKFFLLNVKPPKGGAETFVEMNMVNNNINPTDFEAEKKELLNAINTFFGENNLIPENKIAGKFSKADWGKLNYNHTDHHLRQFGA